MISGQRVLALIPARKNSKGIKNKNIIDLCGKPLILYTVEAARKSQYIDDVILSTDSTDIARIAQQGGAEVPFMRPDELALDQSPTIDAVVHAIKTLKDMGRQYDIFVLLQPTQPLRTSDDIDGALEKFISSGCEGVVSVSAVTDHPILVRSIDEREELVPLIPHNGALRRQDMPHYYRINGCIYINKIDEIDENTVLSDNKRPFIMEESLSVDIDDMTQLYLAEYYLKKQQVITER